MKLVATMTASVLLLGAVLVPQPARAQDRVLAQAQPSASFTIQNLEATATSVRFRVGTGEAARYIESGPITIRGTGQGTFDRERTSARITWDVTAVAPGLQAQGIRSLTLNFVGVAVYDRERDELLAVDLASIGGDAAPAEAPSCTKCLQNINYISKPKDGQQGADWGRGIGGPVEFRSMTADDLDRHPLANMLVQASQAAGLGLASRDMEIVMGQYRREPTKELVVYYPETGEAFSFDLTGRATVQFGQ